MSSFIRRRPLLTSGLAFTGASLCVSAAFPDSTFSLVLEQASRFARTCVVAAAIAVDYKTHFPEPGSYSLASKERRAEVDLRTGSRLLELCLRHGGIFVKAGQYVSTLSHALPEEITGTMAQLQDKARPRDFMQVVQMFRTEFATTHPDEIFDQFSREPIAAASLAQVHTAFIKGTDEKVAVKVQYPRLQNLLKSDLYAMQFVTRLAAMTFVDADFSWIFDDFKPSLLAELNFEGEGKRSERVARNFSGKEEVYVPKVHWDFTSKRILTMEFVEGCKISDLGAIEKMGFKKSKIAEKVVSVFSEMIFCHGFVHCDPHPGNILIRKNPQNHTRFQLVLLDHGLYRELDENFRRDYCSLWKALFYRNEELLKKSAENLGAGRFYKVFPLIFTFKRFDSKNSSVVNSKISPEEREKIKNDVGKVSIGDVNKFLQSLPKDMLLIFRTNALIRSLNYNLGGTTATRLRVMFSHAIRGSLLHNTQPTPLQHDMEVPILLGKPTFFESLLIMFELWRFKITLWFIVIWDSYSKSSIFKSEQPVPITAQISKDPRNPEILG